MERGLQCELSVAASGMAIELHFWSLEVAVICSISSGLSFASYMRFCSDKLLLIKINFRLTISDLIFMLICALYHNLG